MLLKSLQTIIVIAVSANVWHVTVCRELEHVTVFWNSGAYSPMYLETNGLSFLAPFWMHGQGTITNVGLQQSYALRQYLHGRYAGILTQPCYKGALYVKSTDDDIAISSALSVVAGMTPILQYDMWNGSDTSWRPIPIRVSSPNDNDYLSLPKGGAEYNSLRDKIFSSDWMMDYSSNKTDLFQTLLDKTSKSWNVTNIDELATDVAMMLQQPTLSGFARVLGGDGVITGLQQVYSTHLGGLFTDFHGKYATAVSKLQGGVLLNRVVQDILDRVNKSRKMPFLTGYSVPTSTLVGLLVTLGNYDWVAPDVSSAIMIEMYNNNGMHQIEMYYRNGVNTAKPLRIYECNYSCPLENFTDIAERFLAAKTGIEEGGGSSNTTIDNYGNDNRDSSVATCDGILIGFIVALVIVSFLSVGVILYLLKRKAPVNKASELDGL